MEPSMLNDMRTPVQPAGVPVPPITSSPKHPKGLLVALLVLIIIVLAGWAWFSAGPQDATVQVRYDDAGNAIIDAGAGELVDGFPEELIREDGAVITESYLIDYSADGKKMPFASYVSSENYESNVDGFRRLLQAEGWIIQKDGSTTEVPTTNFYAMREGAEVNIVLTQETDMPVIVQISYIASK